MASSKTLMAISSSIKHSSGTHVSDSTYDGWTMLGAETSMAATNFIWGHNNGSFYNWNF